LTAARDLLIFRANLGIRPTRLLVLWRKCGPDRDRSATIPWLSPDPVSHAEPAL